MKTRFQNLCERWLAHFTANKKQILIVERGYQLSENEKALITSSIQKFQIGEASEGKHLQRCAEKAAKQDGNAAYSQCISYLIKEENRHSAYLGNFMKEQNIPKAQSTWTDSVFRMLRKLAGLELSLRILVTAELIALVYYRCLGKATKSNELATICGRMLDEELQHVKFQMAAIHYLNAHKSIFSQAVSDILHVFLLWATTTVVWFEHRAVLRKDCRSLVVFIDEVWSFFGEAMDAGTLELYSEEELVRMEGVAR